jgi:hypothetical protein
MEGPPTLDAGRVARPLSPLLGALAHGRVPALSYLS